MTPRFQHLASIVSSQFGIGVDSIMGTSRPQSISRARFALYALAVADGMSVNEVTEAMGKAKGTIAYGLRMHRDFMTTDHDYINKWIKCGDIASGAKCPHCGRTHTP